MLFVVCLFVCCLFVCLFVCLFADEKNQNNKDERKDIGDYFWGAGYSHGTGFRPFHEKISENPEHKEDFQHHFSHRMGNVNWVCLCCGTYTNGFILCLYQKYYTK